MSELPENPLKPIKAERRSRREARRLKQREANAGRADLHGRGGSVLTKTRRQDGRIQSLFSNGIPFITFGRIRRRRGRGRGWNCDTRPA
jgi:hypothetical protein